MNNGIIISNVNLRHHKKIFSLHKAKIAAFRKITHYQLLYMIDCNLMAKTIFLCLLRFFPTDDI